ncbi:hypothetical protein ACFXTN_011884 [Malus domestica]
MKTWYGSHLLFLSSKQSKELLNWFSVSLRIDHTPFSSTAVVIILPGSGGG